MKQERLRIENIPAVLWGERADDVYLCVHGRMADKEEARGFVERAALKNYQTISFDLPGHGDRKNEDCPCTVWNAVRDLEAIGMYAQQGWRSVSLFGVSLGAYFSLLAYKDTPLKKCLFLSPVLDMERLIRNMMTYFGASEEMLKEEREIPTPMGETLSWDYYCYVRENPIERWNTPTAILYGSEDELVERETVERFTGLFGCNLTVLKGSRHWFHTEHQLAFLDEWLDEHI